MGSARLRIVAMLVVALVLAGMVWTRLAYWQVVQHGQLTVQAQAQYRELVPLPALRGAVYDRNLTQLVVNTTVYSAFVSPDQVAAGQRDAVATGLSTVLGVDRAKVMTTLKSKLQDDLTTAIKARDELRSSTLRLTLTAIQKEEVAGTEARELSDGEVEKIIAREAKKRAAPHRSASGRPP